MIRRACTLLFWFTFSCAASAQSSLNMSQDLVRLGIASANATPNQPGLDAGPLFFKGVLYAQNHQIAKVIVDRGAYYFRSLQFAGAHVAWDSLHNVTIDLQGSDLYFEYPLVDGMVLSNSSNVTLQNFTTDYDPLPFTQVRVTSVDVAQRRIHFAVDGNWQNPTALNAVFSAAPSTYGFGVEVHVFRKGHPVPGIERMYATNPVGSDQFVVAPDPYAGSAVTAGIALIKPGDIAFMGMRFGGGPVNVLYCSGCTFRNIAMYSDTGWGLNAAHTDSSIFEHLYSMPRPGTDRLAGNYVGLYFPFADGPGNQVRLNRIIRSMDNSLEYESDYIGTVRSQSNSRTLVVEGTLATLLSSGTLPADGSAVAFQSISDGTTVASAVTVSHIATPFAGQPSYQVVFTFDRDLPAGVVGTLMFSTDPNRRGANTIIEKNAVEDETDCCIGIQLGGLVTSLARGNYVHRSAMAGIATENTLQPGNNDLPPSNGFTIDNNVLDGVNWTTTGYSTLQLAAIQVNASNGSHLLTTSTHQNISITNNFIADAGSAAVRLGNTGGGSVSGNYFLNPNSNPALQSSIGAIEPAAPLLTPASTNIATGNNTVDRASNRMWVTDGQYRELAAYAPGSTIRLNAYNLGSIVPRSVTFTDAGGVTSTLGAQTVTAHATEVQIPASASLGSAYLTLTSGSLKYFGTLFVDAVDNVPGLNGCTYEVSPESTSIGAAGGNLRILVVTQAGCTYDVVDSDTFVVSGASGTGTGVVSAGFAATSGSVRATTLEVAGEPFTVTQTTQNDDTGPSTRWLLPQFVFGGGWYTALYFSNVGTSPVSFPVTFISNDGTALSVPSVGGSAATVNLDVHGTAVIEAPNVGGLNQGYVSISLPAGVVGYGVFRQSLPGIADQEAVVPLSGASSTTSTLVWDEKDVSTAVAVANPSPVDTTVGVTLWDESGSLVGTSSISLVANNKTAFYLRTLPGLAGMAGKRGSAQFTVSTGTVAVLGLRFDGPAFTSIPATQQ